MRYLVVRTGVAFARSYRRYLQSHDLASDYESFKAKLAIDEQNYCAWPCESPHQWPAKVPTLDRLT